MRRLNIANPEFEYDDSDPAGFRAGVARLGPALGASVLGASVYELPPGETICPYHYEHSEEEWLLVLAGRPTLRHPGGEDELDTWDLVCFPKGPQGAHALRNEGEETVRVLMFSNVEHPAVTVYPDSGKLGVWTEGKVDDVIVRRSDNVDYYDGETG
jgi:uncharacterized cupin superfamily protein